MKKEYSELRSARWMAPDDFRSFGHRSRTMQMGYSSEDWAKKPIIAIINTWSDAQPCHMHFKHRVEDVKRGILQAGGFPMELPALSLSESLVKPTTMLYRNMLAMQAEELLRSHPVDGAVLMGGCDKTTPALVLGAISMDIPAIYLPAGPMLRGNHNGEILGSGTDAFKFFDERRAGNICDDEWSGIEAGIARSYGHCMTMGTASTMTGIAEAMGLCLPGASSIPAPDANHQRMSASCGRRIVDMVWEDLKPSDILTREAIENSGMVGMAMGCSTNSMIHLIAMAQRAGIDFTMDDLDEIGKHVPVLANIRPSGDKYLMEDFYYAGGIRALMNNLSSKLHLNVQTVTGKTLEENLEGSKVFNDDVIRDLDNPIYHEGSLAVLKGNLAPNGSVIKPAACDEKFYKHSGPALVANSYEELQVIIDDENLDIHEDTVLVLRNVGPKGGPGMPEWGMIPIPKALLKKGIRDMVRLSDARMSGTSYGACILHCCPESYVGGPLALLKTGDIIDVDIPNRSLSMRVSDEELAQRKKDWRVPVKKFGRGYGWMFSEHILQADKGCDFDFLTTSFGPAVEEPVIH